jgi:hypothetical protein
MSPEPLTGSVQEWRSSQGPRRKHSQFGILGVHYANLCNQGAGSSSAPLIRNKLAVDRREFCLRSRVLERPALFSV